jgi:hypothetical protein
VEGDRIQRPDGGGGLEQRGRHGRLCFPALPGGVSRISIR